MKVEKFCLNCNKVLTNRQTKYCSVVCQKINQQNDYLKKWKVGLESGNKGTYQISGYIRNYLFQKYNNQCAKCGWNEINLFTGNIPLEVHHIDGNYLNNQEENLTLLCPNCHSITESYKNGNAGNGRKERKK